MWVQKWFDPTRTPSGKLHSTFFSSRTNPISGKVDHQLEDSKYIQGVSDGFPKKHRATLWKPGIELENRTKRPEIREYSFTYPPSLLVSKETFCFGPRGNEIFDPRSGNLPKIQLTSYPYLPTRGTVPTLSHVHTQMHMRNILWPIIADLTLDPAGAMQHARDHATCWWHWGKARHSKGCYLVIPKVYLSRNCFFCSLFFFSFSCRGDEASRWSFEVLG